MKTLKLILLFVLPLTVMISCKSNTEDTPMVSHTFTIEGQIEGLENNTLYYFSPNRDYEALGYRMDSTVVTNGAFKITDSIEGHHFMSFFPRMKQLMKTSKMGGYYPVKSMNLNVILYPGANIQVAGKITDFVEAYPSGDDANNDLKRLHEKAYPLMNESVNYNVQASFEEDEQIKKTLEAKADSVGKIALAVKKDFVVNNPSSVAGLYYLSDMMMRSQLDNDIAINAFNNLDTTLTSISFYKDIAYRVNAINNTKEGALAPAIKTTSTPDGKAFDLASYRGKYVMIDFWGIWCGPCVKEMPQVKEFREKYNDKLEILGINSGDKKQRIIDFANKNEYNWQQVMDDRDSEDNNFVLRYNVNAFPTKFIIDTEGKIVKKFVGSGEEAFTLLEELLK